MRSVIRRVPKLIVAALATLALFWPSTAESPVSAAAPLSPLPKLTIEHQIIEVPTVGLSRARPKPRLSLGHRLAARHPAADRADNFVVRAGRALLGDGRHRPEPFPRPNR